MLNLIRSLLFAAVAFVRARHRLAVEILALRHQLGVLKRSVKRSRLTNADRGLWVPLSRRWVNWNDVLVLVKEVIESPVAGSPRHRYARRAA